MPVVRKLDQEEVQAIETKGMSQRQRVAQEYDEFLMQFVTGDYVEITPGHGETKPAIRHRFNAAAQRLNVDITWLRGKSDTLKLKVENSPFEAAVDEVEWDAGQPEREEETLATYEEPVSAAPVVEETELPELEMEEVEQVAVTEKRKPGRRSRVTDRETFVEAP